MRFAGAIFLTIELTASGCLNRLPVKCLEDSNCDLTTGGICATAPTGNHWCAYSDPSCPGGYRFADQDVGDGVSGMCVAQTDAGIDPPGQACKLRVAFVDGVPPSCGADFPDDGSAHRQVWITNPDGSGAINVSQAAGTDSAHPSWSPDGTKLTFASNPTGHYDIFVVDANGSRLTNLTSGADFPSDASVPVWSPDGTRIAFVYGGLLWSMSADGTGAAPVSSISASTAFAWSPDGKKLVFDIRSSTPNGSALYVAAIEDRSPALKINSGNVSEANPVWAPCPKIIFDNVSDVFTVNEDGSDLFNVTQDAAGNENPVLFDNSNSIVFSSTRNNGHQEIWSIPATGGMATRITQLAIPSSKQGFDVPRAISSDGKLLAFSRVTYIVLPSGPEDCAYQLGISNTDGSNLRLFNAPGGNNATEARFAPCH